jgi:hypothetical protein
MVDRGSCSRRGHVVVVEAASSRRRAIGLTAREHNDWTFGSSQDSATIPADNGSERHAMAKTGNSSSDPMITNRQVRCQGMAGNHCLPLVASGARWWSPHQLISSELKLRSNGVPMRSAVAREVTRDSPCLPSRRRRLASLRVVREDGLWFGWPPEDCPPAASTFLRTRR